MLCRAGRTWLLELDTYPSSQPHRSSRGIGPSTLASSGPRGKRWHSSSVRLPGGPVKPCGLFGRRRETQLINPFRPLLPLRRLPPPLLNLHGHRDPLCVPTAIEPLELMECEATGSAGLINTISSLATGHILAGVFGVLASLGWVVQAAGGGILYKRVSPPRCPQPSCRVGVDLWNRADGDRSGITRTGTGISTSRRSVYFAHRSAGFSYRHADFD